jgi:hypothetical protein
MKIDLRSVGYIILGVGSVLEIQEYLGRQDALNNGTNYNDTIVGNAVYSIEQYLPTTLGWALMIAGASIVWIVPKFVKG